MALALTLVPGGPAPAQESGELAKVEVKPGQNIRDIAREYLGDPDLWIEILRANDLKSVTDVVPGLELMIPVTQVSDTNRSLARALEVMQRATEEGARLFAADLIAQAIQLREQALARRQEGVWAEAARLAAEAEAAADEALAVALEQRDAAAEALLSDRQGWVEGQRPQELAWTDRTLHAVLIEEEKVRTLSRSTAQITFKDESRLRLNANSQALIQRMRVDPLSRKEEAKVSLVAGDFYALLAGKSERKSFELEVPEVETRIESENFWVRRDDSGSKFANYDEKVLEVTAQGESVGLGRNEATLVRSGAPPSDKIDLLPAPALRLPEDDQVAFNAEVELAWSPVDDAAGYWLEVANDSGFRRMTLTRWGLPEPHYEDGTLGIGAYYWRVAALDKFGVPGERSDVRRFHVRTDTTPPYLSIGTPAEGTIQRRSPLVIQGESEVDATLVVAGRTLEVDPAGRFEVPFEPVPGPNRLTITATDPAGNVTERSRSFVFMPDEQAAVQFDDALPRQGDRHFVTAGDLMSIGGRTEEKARLVVRSEDGAVRASAYADADGRFGLNVPMRAAHETFDLEVVAPSGFATSERFEITVDEAPPRIELEAPPPSVTAVEWLPLRGRVDGGSDLLVAGEVTELQGDTFERTVTLKEGINTIELVSSDLVGNVGVEKLEIFLDQEPPEFVRQSLSTSRVRGGESVMVEVVARDASGVKQAAPFTLEVGGRPYADFLRFNKASESYRSAVVVPPDLSGAVVLKDVELEDYAGNRKRYTFR